MSTQGSTFRCDACGIGYSVGAAGDYVVLRPSQRAVLDARQNSSRRSISNSLRRLAGAAAGTSADYIAAVQGRVSDFMTDRGMPAWAIALVLAGAAAAGVLIALAGR